MTTESEMIAAHKNGRAEFHRGNASVSMARTMAHKLYATTHERESFIAGYIGEMNRHANI
jgi:hypothetical protein